MKNLSKTFFVFVLSFIGCTNLLYARNITSSSYANDTRINPPSVLSRDYNEYARKYSDIYGEYYNEDEEDEEYTEAKCITKYMEALDKECYDANNVADGGVYADCNDNTMTEYFDIMDMQLSRIVGISDFKEYKEECEGYKGTALNQWLSAKTIVEESAIKGSSECVLANKKLTAAKQCYTAAIAHDGNSFEFDDLMMLTCGDFPDVALKFSKAGDLGLANIPQLLENYSTFQFTNKSEDWRQAVEAILAGYTYDAKQACGEETYDLLQLNEFSKDNRENLLTLTADSFAEEFGSNLGNRVSESISGSNNYMSFKYYEGIGWVDENQLKKEQEAEEKLKKEQEEQVDPLSVNEIYVIEGVTSLNNTRARLLNIMTTGDVGTSETQDAIDRAIIIGLGGRLDSMDTIIYNTISNLSEGDSFVIKQKDNQCQVLMIDNYDNLVKLEAQSIKSNKALSSYIYDCKRIVE